MKNNSKLPDLLRKAKNDLEAGLTLQSNTPNEAYWLQKLRNDRGLSCVELFAHKDVWQIRFGDNRRATDVSIFSSASCKLSALLSEIDAALDSRTIIEQRAKYVIDAAEILSVDGNIHVVWASKIFSFAFPEKPFHIVDSRVKNTIERFCQEHAPQSQYVRGVRSTDRKRAYEAACKNIDNIMSVMHAREEFGAIVAHISENTSVRQILHDDIAGHCKEKTKDTAEYLIRKRVVDKMLFYAAA